MKVCINCFWYIKIFLLVSVFVLNLSGAEADKGFFNTSVKPFLEKHCTSCHGEKKKKGNVLLHDISFDLANAKDLKRWQAVLEQLALGEMPPEKKPRPDYNEQSAVIDWIDRELAKSGNVSDLAVKLKGPGYGNYISHEKLFSGDIKEKAWSPARLWRKNPNAFDYSKHFVFGKPNYKMFWEPTTHFGGLDTDRPDPLPGVKQAFPIEDKNGFKDYASLLYADSATLGTLMRNAAFIADLALEGAVKELELKNQGKTLREWRQEISAQEKAFSDKLKDIQTRRDAEGKKNGTKSELYQSLNNQWQKLKRSWKAPKVKDSREEYRKVALFDGTPPDALIHNAISVHFENIMHRKPLADELSKYSAFMKKTAKEAGNVESLRLTMMALIVSPEAVYRMELGLGKKDAFGRSMLSPAELAFAISLALTDGPPDAVLFKAAKEGRLNSKDDIRRELVRILEDESIQKPRILRFFHEFFGYHRATAVFKDEKRFKGKQNGSYRPEQLVTDTDTLVKYIVKNDKNVLRELLTTDRYFVIHKGDNERAREESDAIEKIYRYFKDRDWKKQASLDSKDKEFIRSLNKTYFYKRHFFGHPEAGAIKRLMTYYEKCKKLGIRPVPVYSWGDKDLGPLTSYNLDLEKWSYEIQQPTKMGGRRVGILSHPSWLIAHSLNVENDPVRRGKWIRERLLGGTIPDVPITVDASIPEDPHKTLRERLAVTEKEECWRCHKKMNPLGYTFESFDDFGIYREEEELEHQKKVKGRYPVKAVNAKGYLDGTGDDSLDGELKDHVDLMHRLAASEKVRQVFVRHAFRYWMGRNEMLSDSEVLIAADKAYTENGGSFKSLIISLLSSDSFIYRKSLD